MLGPLVVWTDQGEPVAIPGGKVTTLLAVLLVHARQPVSTDRLIDALWPRNPPRDAGASLQVRVSQLRGALAAAELGARDLVVSQASGYQLNVTPEAVDAGQFEALVAVSTTDLRSRDDSLARALKLWRGMAFAEFADAEFAEAETARLDELRLAVLEVRAELRLELGEHAELVGDLSSLVTRYPLRERLRAAQLRALYRSGRQGDALTSYTELRQRLRDELGVDPSPELAALHRAILEQDPLLAPRPVVTNLPESLTELIGREEAVRDVRARSTEHRLVTLTGPGGVGKTRLAVEAAMQLTANHRDGVWLVELAGIDPVAASTTVIVDTVQAVLGIRGAVSTSGQPVDHLGAALRTKQLLLVLDNCEHLTEQVAPLTEQLLRSAPELRILATSQEPLGVAGEVIIAVPPLELPHSPADTGPEILHSYSAVRLFTARVAAAAPGFALDVGNAAAVVAICRRLDGIPLALELAATRVRVLGVAELAARMDDRLHLLVAGRRGGPRRQRTLRAMIDWSWEQLADPEQFVLRRLSVHADSFGLTAIEEICAEEDLPRTRIVESLARLVDRSLVVMTENEQGPRYRLPESVSLYCSERLAEAGETNRVRDMRNRYFTALSERARPQLRGAEQRRWLAILDLEYANLRLAVEDSARRGRCDLALRLVDALAWYWYLRGRIEEGARLVAMATSADNCAEVASARAKGWAVAFALLGNPADLADRTSLLHSGLAGFDQVRDPAGRAHTQWMLAESLLGGGEQTVSQSLAADALAGFRAVGDRWGTAAALSSSAHHALLRGDLDLSARDANESASLFSILGDRWGQLRAADLLARHAEIIGDYPEATRLRRDGLCRAEELGLWPQVADMSSGLGRLALLDGDLDRAQLLHERARDLSISQGRESGRVFAEVGLGIGARRAGRLVDAETHTRVSLDWNRQVDYAPGIAQSLAELGFIAELRGDTQTARALHEQGLEAARRSGDPRAIALAEEGLAGAAALAGYYAEAARLLASAATARELAGAPLPPQERTDVDRITARIRAGTAESRTADDAP